MYFKTVCSHCGKRSYTKIMAELTSGKTDLMLTEIKVVDTIKEEDLLRIVSQFISNHIENGTSAEDIQEILSRCMGISPQYTAELITRIVLESNTTW